MFELSNENNLTRCSALGDGSSVLVVEDDVATRQIICNVLAESGFRVVAATDGADALCLAAEGRPDILVVNCDVSGLGGVELCRTLRQDVGRPQVPILLTMVDASPEMVTDAFDAGATDFVPLPFNWSLLPFRVSYLLRAHRVALQLNSSENRQHTLLDGIPDPVLVFERNCKIVWANSSSVESLRLSRNDLVGKTCRDVWGVDNGRCDSCDIARCFDSGKVVTGKRSSVDGKVWGVRLFPIRNDSGQIETVVKLAHDITDKIKMQTEATRTSQLAVIGELAAGVAHEINNPIHGVINYAQILINREDASSENMELVRRIQKEGERVADIVQSLLGFSRPASDDFITGDVLEALGESISLFESKLRSNHIRLRVRKCDGPLLVRSRKQQLQQVFINLISNARQALNGKTFVRPEEKSLEIDVERVQYNGLPMLSIRFFDQGCGIPAEMIDRVTQPFFTTKPAGQGTGLGLSISDTIVREHEGHLNIESQEGAFTRVTLNLPLT